MIPSAQRICSSCKLTHNSNANSVLCDTCNSKSNVQNSAMAANNQPSSQSKLIRNFHLDVQKRRQKGNRNEVKSIELELSDDLEKLCCNCLLLGSFLGQQIILIQKNPKEGGESDKLNQLSTFSQLRDEEFEEKKDKLCKGLDIGIVRYAEILDKLEQLINNGNQNLKEADLLYSPSLKSTIDELIKAQKGDKLIDHFSQLRKELDNASKMIKQWIEDMRVQPFPSDLKDIKVNIAEDKFSDFLEAICRFELADKFSLINPEINEENKQEGDQGKALAAGVKKQSVQDSSQKEEPGLTTEDMLRLIASNFDVYRQDEAVEFNLYKSRVRFPENLRLCKNWSTFQVEKLRLVITCSMISKKIKQCLNYIFSKSYFSRVEIVVKVDEILETTVEKFYNLFDGIAKLKTLSKLSIEIIDSAQAHANSDNLLAFIQGRLPPGVTKRLVLGWIAISISYDLAQVLEESKLKVLDQFSFSLVAYEIDNDQLANLGREWAHLTKIKSLNLHLNACNLISSFGIKSFLDATMQQGSDIEQANLEIEDCDRIDENDLDMIIAQSNNNLALTL